MKTAKIYIYPNTSYLYLPGINDYIPNLITHLGKKNIIVNKPTKVGLVDLLKSSFSCDIIYFNWIEDLGEKRYGYLQLPLLFMILVIARLRHVKIVWFIHNNISHVKKGLFSKRVIIWLMKRFSDVILSHVQDVRQPIDEVKFSSFDHPVGPFRPLAAFPSFEYDLLIWGGVSPYKGVLEFVQFAASSDVMKNMRILIAGQFSSGSYYESVIAAKTPSIKVMNELIPEDELERIIAVSRYILFTYNSSSVLSSAALCKSLSFGKEIIGPDTGAFSELSDKHIIHSYRDFEDLELLIQDLRSKKVDPVQPEKIREYAQRYSWDAFGEFLHKKLVVEN